MELALIEKRIPEANIVVDFTGFRNLDSVVRACETFDQSNFLVKSPPFHNERAVYISQQYGVKLTGFNTPDVGDYGGWKTKFREKPARVRR
jgi:SanA protein